MVRREPLGAAFLRKPLKVNIRNSEKKRLVE